MTQQFPQFDRPSGGTQHQHAPNQLSDAAFARQIFGRLPQPSNPWDSSQMAQCYGKFAQARWYQELLQAMTNFLPEAELGRPIIDIGAGTGAGTRALAERFGPFVPILGVDTSSSQLAYARALSSSYRSVDYYEGSVESLSRFLTLVPQMITAFNSIHLLGDFNSLLGKVRPALRSGDSFTFCTGYFSEMHRTPESKKLSNNLLQQITTSVARAFPEYVGQTCPHMRVHHLDLTLMPLALNQQRFALERLVLHPVELPAEALIDFLIMPGTGQALVPPTIPEAQRRQLIAGVLQKNKVTSLSRNWCFAHLRKI